MDIYRAELRSAASWVMAHSFSRVSIQFSDQDLAHSSEILTSFKTELRDLGCDMSKCTVFALADSTYNPLEVDEVAAAHFHADCVVHLGRASLAPVTSLPSYMAFGQRSIDVASLTRAVESALASSSSSDVDVTVLILDQPYLHARDAVTAALTGQPIVVADALSRELYPRGLPRMPDARPLAKAGGCCGEPSTSCSAAPADASTCCDAQQPANCSTAARQQARTAEPAAQGLAGYVWPGCDAALSCDFEASQRKRFVWVGSLEVPALRELQMLQQAATWISLTPTDEANAVEFTASEGLVLETQRLLKKRYFLLEKARCANIVGILVGTLGVAGFSDAVHRIRKLAEEAGKKTYTALVGKPSPAKLANFPEVEVWVHVASGQGVLLDSKEYLAPIITVFEAELALRDLDWPTQYRLGLDPIESDNDATKSDSPRFSLLTGGVIASKPAAKTEEGGSADSQLALATERALKLKEDGTQGGAHNAVTVQSAAEYLIAKRTYQGLETPMTGAEKLAPMMAVEGLSGRAAVYENEGKNA